MVGIDMTSSRNDKINNFYSTQRFERTLITSHTNELSSNPVFTNDTSTAQQYRGIFPLIFI